MPVHYPSDFSLDKASSRYYTYWALFRSKLKLLDKRIRSEKAVIIEPDVEFRLTDNAKLQIGEHSVISRYAQIFMTKPNPICIIGKQVCIGRGSMVNVKQSVSIGDFTRLGAYVIITDHMHEAYEDSNTKLINTKSYMKPIVIGKNVWIGNYATIFPGVTIGEGAIINTYSLVMNDVPPHTVVAGQPARIVKSTIPREASKMTLNRTHERLVDIFCDVLNLGNQYPKEQIPLLSQNEEGWDSVQMVNLFIAIEEEFALRIPEDVGYTLDSFSKFEDFLTQAVEK